MFTFYVPRGVIRQPSWHVKYCFSGFRKRLGSLGAVSETQNPPEPIIFHLVIQRNIAEILSKRH